MLEYIYHNHIPIADVYGEVVADYGKGEAQAINRGLGFWLVVEWINVHGKLHIAMPHREEYLGQYMTEDTEKLLAS